MSVQIRDARPSDAEVVYQIRSHPLVQPHQFRLAEGNAPDRWLAEYFALPSAGKPAGTAPKPRCVIVEFQEVVVGHINVYSYETGGAAACYLGWNLAPDYWGQGIMRDALTQALDELFREGVEWVFCDCFARNTRCLKLIRRLGFVPGVIGPLARLHIAWRHGCQHWLRRFYLTPELWRRHEDEPGL